MKTAKERESGTARGSCPQQAESMIQVQRVSPHYGDFPCVQNAVQVLQQYNRVRQGKHHEDETIRPTYV